MRGCGILLADTKHLWEALEIAGYGLQPPESDRKKTG
jgi:hypothetical protein